MGIDGHIVYVAPVGDHYRQVLPADVPNRVGLTPVGGERRETGIESALNGAVSLALHHIVH